MRKKNTCLNNTGNPTTPVQSDKLLLLRLGVVVVVLLLLVVKNYSIETKNYTVRAPDHVLAAAAPWRAVFGG